MRDDCLLLGRRQALDYLRMRARVSLSRISSSVAFMHPGIWLLFGFRFAGVPPRAHKPASCAGHQSPVAGPASPSSREVCPFAQKKFFALDSKSHEDLLQEIIGLGFVMNHLKISAFKMPLYRS